MRRQVTRNEVNRFKNIYICNELETIRQFLNADYYNAGVYGWNYDGYIIDIDNIILIGYRNFPKSAINTGLEIQKKYCDDMQQYINNSNDYVSIKKYAKSLIYQMIEELAQNKNNDL